MIEPLNSYFEATSCLIIYAAILLRNISLLFNKMRGPGGEQTRRLSTAVLFAGPQTPGLRTPQGNAPGKAAHVTPRTAGLCADGQSWRRFRSDLLSASSWLRRSLAALFWGSLAALFWGALATEFWGPLAALFRSPLAG